MLYTTCFGVHGRCGEHEKYITMSFQAVYIGRTVLEADDRYFGCTKCAITGEYEKTKTVMSKTNTKMIDLGTKMLLRFRNSLGWSAD